jgi:hypothetical protein
LCTPAVTWKKTYALLYFSDKKPSVKSDMRDSVQLSRKNSTEIYGSNICEYFHPEWATFEGKDRDSVAKTAICLDFLVPTFKTEKYFLFLLLFLI